MNAWQRTACLLLIAAPLPASAFDWPWSESPAWHVAITAPAASLPEERLHTWQDELEAMPAAADADTGYDRYRLERQRVYLLQSLHAAGYFDAGVEAAWDEAARTAHFALAPGPLYHFGKVKLHAPALPPGQGNVPPPLLLAAPSAAALTDVVLQDEDNLRTWLGNTCLFNYDVRHEAVLNTKTHRVDIDYRVSIGRPARFGAIRFTGQESVATDYLAFRTLVKPGDCFSRSELNKARVELQKTGLFASVQPIIPEARPESGQVPVEFRMRERAHRTVKGGVSYGTDIGPGVSAGWEHRNLLSRGEKFTVDASINRILSSLDTQLEKPFFLRRDQKLKLGAKLERQDSDAFTTSGLTLSAGVERDFERGLTAGLGAKYGFNRVKDATGEQDVALLSSPGFVARDARDNMLDPASGYLLRMEAAPFIDTLDWQTTFFKVRAQAQGYYTVPAATRPVLALRLASGSISGVNTQAVPATERFYSGGAMSVRGYGYQLAGPLDTSNDPLGGRSFFEMSAELRGRIYGDYGAAVFVDSGSAFDAATPDFDQQLKTGVGFGLRYFSSFGPLRADIAFPTGRRRGVDAAYQLYFSIGQAF